MVKYPVKKSKKMVKKRVYKKRSYKRSIASWYPLGKVQVGKLRYCESINIDPGAGVFGSYTYAANGMYDCNISGTGHQPYSFDQFMALYNKYQVLGAKMTVRLLNVGANSPNCWFSIKLSDSTTLNTGDSQYALEQPGFGKKYYVQNGSQAVPKVSCKFSASKFFAISKKAIAATDTLTGTSSSNPIEGAFFVICFGPLISGENLASFTIQVEIDYIARFTGPRELTSS